MTIVFWIAFLALAPLMASGLLIYMCVEIFREAGRGLRRTVASHRHAQFS